jgi:hypothetical protein
MFCIASIAITQEAPSFVPPEEAWRYKGQDQKVCGQIIDTSYATSVSNAATYLYLDRPRPEQVFTVEIPSAQRGLFGDNPEKSLKGKSVCVTGKIEGDGMDGAVDRKRRARVVIEDEDQIVVR